MSNYNVPDIATLSNVFNFYDVDGKKITINSFILTHPKTNERVIQNILSTNNFHLTVSDTITLANSLMDLSTKANEINTKNNAILISKLQFRKYLESGKFSKVKLEYVADYEPVIPNYQMHQTEEQVLPGYKKFVVTPIWKPLAKLNPEEEYYFVDYIFISPFYSEFERQMDFFGGVENIEFVNFSYGNYISEVTEKLHSNE